MTPTHELYIRRRVILNRTMRNHSNREILLALKALNITADERVIRRDRAFLRKEGLLK